MAAFMRNNGLTLAKGFIPNLHRQWFVSRIHHGELGERVPRDGGLCCSDGIAFPKGSPESKSESDARSESSAPHITRHSPWPVRRGGLALKIYKRSLSLAFCMLFFLALTLHAYGGWRAFNEQQLMHGGPQVSLTDFIGSSHFWYQSLQNWQSEFLGLGTMVLLSIWLRQKGSPQSKPVEAPHEQTGR